MLRSTIRNRSFDWMGENFTHLIDGEHLMGRSSFDIPRRRRVAANLAEDEEEYTLELAVPGFKKEDLEIVLDQDMLRIVGKRSATVETNDQRYLINEFGVESFERLFKLASDIADDRIEAKLEYGILTVRFFKRKGETTEAAQRINIG